MTDTQTVLATRHVPEGLPDRIQHYIDGAFVDSLDGDTFDVLDPVTNETYVQAAAGKKADIDRAVAAARRAFTEGPRPRRLPRAGAGSSGRLFTTGSPRITWRISSPESVSCSSRPLASRCSSSMFSDSTFFAR